MSESYEAYIVCLACYNAGAPTGIWVDGAVAESTVPCTVEWHEEYWVTDHNIPRAFLPGECSPWEFSRMAEVLEAFTGALGELAAVVEDQGLSGDREEICILVDEWAERVMGSYDDLTDLAYEYVENCGGVENLGAAMCERYFDYHALGRDMGLEGNTVELADGRILLVQL